LWQGWEEEEVVAMILEVEERGLWVKVENLAFAEMRLPVG
jgi:hypothetical protein